MGQMLLKIEEKKAKWLQTLKEGLTLICLKPIVLLNDLKGPTRFSLPERAKNGQGGFC